MLFVLVGQRLSTRRRSVTKEQRYTLTVFVVVMLTGASWAAGVAVGVIITTLAGLG